MRSFVLISCVLAVASAAWNQPPPGGYHIPQITSAGVPLETPEVQAAKAAHFAAFQGVAPQQSYQGQNGNNGNNNGERNYENVRYYGPHAYQTTNGAAKVSAGGVPLDTPEVQAAKSTHFGLFSQALSRNAQHAVPHYRRRRGIYGAPWAYGHHVPLITASGVPLDTPEVQHAKAAHFAAHANAGGFLGGFAAPIHPVAGFFGLNHDGRPLDTPEVAHAKAAHYAAFNQAAALNGVLGGHLDYAPHIPAVPADTPEVAHAKAAHLAAHAAASHHY